jgi:hypothetical protein
LHPVIQLSAQMAELVDALDSKSGYRKVVQVRFLFWALKTPDISMNCRGFVIYENPNTAAFMGRIALKTGNWNLTN